MVGVDQAAVFRWEQGNPLSMIHFFSVTRVLEINYEELTLPTFEDQLVWGYRSALRKCHELLWGSEQECSKKIEHNMEYCKEVLYSLNYVFSEKSDKWERALRDGVGLPDVARDILDLVTSRLGRQTKHIRCPKDLSDAVEIWGIAWIVCRRLLRDKK
jgi:hypothetical protein